MGGTSLFKNAGLYRETRKRWSATAHQIVTVTSKGEALVHDTVSEDEAIALRDGLIESYPLPAPAPAPTPAPTPSGPLVLGVVLGSNWSGMPAKVKAAFGPTAGRIAYDAGDTAAQMMVREAKAAGIDPHLMLPNWQMTPTEFVTVVKRYLALGVRRFEIGNETSYVPAAQVPSIAAAYARQLKAFGEALKAAGVTGVELLAQADDALRNAGWVKAMFQAVANLADYVFGWVVHPYTAGREVERLNKAVTDLQAQGVTDPEILATEYGIAATVDGVTLTLSNGTPDNYGHPTNLTTKQAGPLVVQTIEAMRRGCRYLRGVWVYHATNGRGAHTLRETNFGQTTWPDLVPITDRTEPLKQLAASLGTTG